MSDTPGTQLRWHPFHGLLIGLVVAGLLLGAWFFLAMARAERGLELGWSARPDREAASRMVVSSVSREEVAPALEVGDRILSVNGDARVSPKLLWPHFFAMRAGDPYRMTVERDGERIELHARAGLSELKRDRAWRQVWLRLPFVIVTFLVGTLLGLLRPSLPVARLVSLYAIPYSVFTLWAAAPTYLLEPVDDCGRMAIEALLFLSNPGAYHLFAVFPAASRPRTKSILAFWVVGLAIVSFEVVDAIAFLQPTASRLDWLEALGPWRGQVMQATRVYWLVAVFAIILVVVANYRAADGPATKRRIRWVVAGVVVGLLPTLARALIDLAQGLDAGGLFTNPTLRRVIDDTRFVLLCAIPLSIAYASARHHLLDIRFVVRRGVRHLLARRSLQLLTLLPALLLTISILGGQSGPLASLTTWRPAALGLLGLTLLAQWKRTEWLRWLDQRFFRNTYDRHVILSELIQQTSRQTTLPGLLKQVRRTLMQAFHPRAVSVLARDLGGQRVFHESGSEARVSFDDSLILEAESLEAPVDLPSGASLPLPGVSEPARLVVPVRDREGELVAVIGLGERASEEPYSREDRQLCSLLAGQVAIAYENALLKEQVESAARRREEMLAGLEEAGVPLLKECPACGRCFDHEASRCELDESELVLTLPVERLLHERYRLDRRIGRGGMGAVYEAHDERLDRTVAVKLMLGRSFGDATALRRFESEARSLARVTHPNVVAVHDYGVTGHEGAFLVMELLQGEPLSALVAQGGRVEPATAANWIDQACKGVSAIHASGIVHRDLKPANLILVGSDEEDFGRIKIVDFGLAKMESASGTQLTATDTVVGTPAYMAPEQLSGEGVDERTDVYALAIIAVELLTGRHPSLVEGGLPRPLVGLSRPVRLEGGRARGLNAVLARCLATAREKRPADVDELRAELVPLMRRCTDLRLEAAPVLQALPTVDGPRRSG